MQINAKYAADATKHIGQLTRHLRPLLLKIACFQDADCYKWGICGITMDNNVITLEQQWNNVGVTECRSHVPKSWHKSGAIARPATT